jgi:hypothetical protein
MILILASISAFAGDEGFVEIRGTAYAGVDGKPWQLVERARPRFELDLRDNLQLVTTLEASFSQGRRLQDEVHAAFDDSDFGPMLAQAGCVWPAGPANNVLGIDGTTDWLSVDRLYLDWYTKKADIRIGRQALQWGSAILINPADPFPEVLFNEPWRPRAGVNSIRANIPLGKDKSSNLLQLVVASNDSFTKARGALKATVDIKGTDVALVGAYRGDADDGIVGLDVKGTLGVGFWLEGAVHVNDDPYEEIAVGIDYSFPWFQTFVISAQYYRNGAGETDPFKYDYTSRSTQSIEPPDCGTADTGDLFAAAAPNPFAPFTLGTDYVMAQVSAKLTDDVTVSTVGFHNLRDGTGIAVVSANVTPTGATEVALTAQIPYRAYGETGEFKPADAELVIRQPSPAGGVLTADMSGLVPDATFTLWMRYNF